MKNTYALLMEKVTPSVHSALYWTLADMLILAKRQLRRIPRNPQELVTVTLEPVLLVVFFRYIFGGAIPISGTSYVNYLIGGMLVMSVIISSANTGVGVAVDLQRGLVDRFRSLPMAKSAVLTGRTFADLIVSTFIILVVWAVGLLIGFRPEGTVLSWLAALGLLLLGSFMFSWISAFLGLVLNSVEAVTPAVSVYAFLLIFVSGAFVPTNTLPDWLRPFAEHQPISLLINAIRGLILNHPDVTATWQAIVWCVSLLAIFIPLAIWAYERRTAR